ncbi:hypothetical protein D7U89_03940 [Stenotrophomonas maltophilia]|uniref:DUF6404 family protein n=1 Tax=Stenotrophomonas TaxID=40323 RepID=UPI001311778F|nr:DUF6404 family protein [Stenotrophomonas maltophilia]MBA0224650.1 hypothetical protein [Stenotrophomonas maltophilia]MBA0366232.1 hypothetical protein [Stenotrophomonas maltophilia]MBA0403765.1 hypothetical protein [Stenotrophomonas maltophilia]MCF3519209.1 hypothetical protein [Stenotrophomonas maltophilia]
MSDINPRYPAVIQSALRFLDGQGLARVQSAPLLHRLLWRLGIALPPPILAGFATNALVQGLLFGLFWTALMWLMLWQGSERPLALLLVAGLSAGVLFGIVMAALMRSLRRHRKLPDWRRFRARQAD